MTPRSRGGHDRRRAGADPGVLDVPHDPHDWDDPSGEGKPAEQVCSAVVSDAQPGDVILMHDRFAGTVEAAPCVIRGLRGEGLEPGRLEVAQEPSAKNGDSFIEVVP